MMDSNYTYTPTGASLVTNTPGAAAGGGGFEGLLALAQRFAMMRQQQQNRGAAPQRQTLGRQAAPSYSSRPDHEGLEGLSRAVAGGVGGMEPNMVTYGTTAQDPGPRRALPGDPNAVYGGLRFATGTPDDSRFSGGGVNTLEDLARRRALAQPAY